MNEVVYEIKDLTCTYNGVKDVLKVKNLKIIAGKIVVLLGASGAGKSTILETLGLMNKTIKNGSKVLFSPNGENYNFSNLWERNQHETMANIRRRHFSFIFQNTNLMPNFTAYENISITQMIEGVSKKDAIVNAETIANSLGLDIDKNKKAFEMSGGEKQRAAFIRAIAPDFTVLFGDEPTGNLDRKNASLLLGKLRDTIISKNKTAVIVSHDIDLALQFADTIILLKKVKVSNQVEYSEITNQTIFQSKEVGESKIWLDFKNQDITQSIEQKIEEIFD